MTRYFFHVRTKLGLAVDEEGDDLLDDAAARKEAVASVRDIVAQPADRDFEDWLSCAIEVTDETGRQVLSLDFRDVLLD